MLCVQIWCECLKDPFSDDSKILAAVGRRDIGRRLVSMFRGGETLGIGTTSTDFQRVGKNPSLMDAL